MDLRARLEAILNDRVTALTPLAGGCVGRVARADLGDGTSVVVKTATPGGASLDVEGFMLRSLASLSGVRVPRVIHDGPDLLVMEHIPNDGACSKFGLIHLGDSLSAIHGVTSDRFGFDRDTLIGPLPQPNPWTGSWPEFFGRWRLQAMARAARDEGRLEKIDVRRIDRLCDRLDQLIEPDPTPSLIHGDLWSGNVLWHQGGLAALIDPGCYYGVDEVDLAMMALFGGFGQAFWDRYREVRGIREGFWEPRQAIYQLYPLLVHVRLFGGGYVGQVRGVLERFV